MNGHNADCVSLQAIGRGDVEKVTEWVDSMPCKRRESMVNDCKHSCFGKSALHFACEHNHTNIAKVLVEAGAGMKVFNDTITD